jgi:hypothetical protein
MAILQDSFAIDSSAAAGCRKQNAPKRRTRQDGDTVEKAGDKVDDDGEKVEEGDVEEKW